MRQMDYGAILLILVQDGIIAKIIYFYYVYLMPDLNEANCLETFKNCLGIPNMENSDNCGKCTNLIYKCVPQYTSCLITGFNNQTKNGNGSAIDPK